MRQAGWDWDVYRDKIIVWHKGEWRWAQIPPDMVTLAPRQLPNEHELITFANGLNKYELAPHEISLDFQEAILNGLVAIDKPLTHDECRRYHHVRYGRVAVARGIVHVDAPDLDFGEADHICPSYLGADDYPSEYFQVIAMSDA